MNDRFTPRTPLTQQRLEAYAKGTLPPQEQHDVELQLEESALHREALEGLRAVPGAHFSGSKHPAGSSSKMNGWLASAGLLLLVGAAVWMLAPSEMDSRPSDQQVVSAAEIPSLQEHSGPQTIPSAEITAATEIPESLQIGHGTVTLLPSDSAVRMAGPGADVLETRSTSSAEASDRSSTPERAARGSRKLLFLHGLKLVDPEELYASDPLLVADPGGVPANLDGHDDPLAPSSDERAVPYTRFMDHALGLFAEGDHKAALTELKQVLRQYPDDVNARFYAGLCCYNLGLFTRAKAFFLYTAHAPVDSFNEEALWYHALSVQHADGAGAADLLFERIAAEGGFYASRAKEKLQSNDGAPPLPSERGR